MKSFSVFQNRIKCTYKKLVVVSLWFLGAIVFNFEKLNTSAPKTNLEKIILYINSLNKYFIKMKEVFLDGKSLFMMVCLIVLLMWLFRVLKTYSCPILIS